MKQSRNRKMIVILVCLSGLLAGMLVPEALRMGEGNYAGFTSLYSFQKYENMTVSYEKILLYIFHGRMKMLLFLWMSSFSAVGFFCHLVYGWWLAASGGMLLSLFLLKEGYGGIPLFFCCLFPQWIWYGAMWKKEFIFLWDKWRYDFTGHPQVRPVFSKNLVELGKMTALCLGGTVTETFLGTWTLKIFLQFFT